MNKRIIAVLICAALLIASGCVEGTVLPTDAPSVTETVSTPAEPAEPTEPSETDAPDETAAPATDDQPATDIPEVTTDVPVETTPEPPAPMYAVTYAKGNTENWDGRFNIDLLYLTCDGYPTLASAVTAENLRAWNDYHARFLEAVELGIEKPGFYRDNVTVERSDSEIFSYVRTVIDFRGGAHTDDKVTGYNFDVQTGGMLSLKQIVSDYDGLYNVLAGILEADPAYSSNLSATNGWKDNLKKHFDDETIEWVITETGLKLWVNPGVITYMAAGEVGEEIKVSEHRELFGEDFARYYDGGIEVLQPDNSSFRTAFFDGTVTKLIAGIGSMSYPDAVALINGKAQYEGQDWGEIESETNAWLLITDPDSGIKYYVYFYSDGIESVEFSDAPDPMYADNAYGSFDHIRYEMVDPWIHLTTGEIVGVEFGSVDDYALVYFVTINRYFSK